MKKYIVLLLSLILTIALFSCYTVDIKENGTASDKNGSTKDTAKADRPTILVDEQYYKIEQIGPAKVRYYIYDPDGNTVLSDETDRPLNISMLGDSIVDICVSMGTGLGIHKYYDIQNNRSSEEYSYVAASSSNLVAYIDTSMEEPLFNRVLVVRDIFDKNVFYRSFGLDFSPSVDFPIESAKFTEGEAEIDIVYLSERPAIPMSITLPIRRETNMYEAVLNSETKVVYASGMGSDYLANCLTPYTKTPLCELDKLGYLYMDIDGDKSEELIIDCGDILILRHYNSKVYLYELTFRQMNRLYTDGSYSWNYSGERFEYGESSLYFDGTDLKTKEVWRVVDDGEPNAEYYIGGERVTSVEIQKYFAENKKEEVKFSPLEAVWLGKISFDEAFELANKHFNNIDGNMGGACGTSYFNKLVVSEDTTHGDEYYSFVWRMISYYHVEEGWESRVPSSVDMSRGVLVDIRTGRCEDYAAADAPYRNFEDTPEGATISGEEAIKIAKKYWEKLPLTDDHEILRSINFDAPSSVYVFGLHQNLEECRYKLVDEIWIDSGTGEITFSHLQS